MNNLQKFIKREKVLLIILFLMFLNPFFYGYRVGILFFFFLFFKLKFFLNKFDKNVTYLFLFASSYELLAAMRVDALDKSIFSIIPNIFIPALLYLIGVYITSVYQSGKIRIFVLFFIAFSFSLVPVFSILLQIIQNGFSTGTRSMHLIWNKNDEIVATGLGSYLGLNMASIALINIPKTSVFEKRITYCALTLFILSLVCIVRLGDRTELAIALFALLLSYLVNFRRQSLLKNAFMLCVFGSVLFYIYNNIETYSKIMSFYSSRMNSRDAGIETVGGRSKLWVESFQSIFTDPNGWKLSRFGYAHNLWLDVARVSGIVPLVILIFFTFSSIKVLIKSLKVLKNELFLRTYILIFFVGTILIFMVEPVMEGLYLLFLLFCLFVGYLSGIVSQSKTDPNKQSLI